MINHFQPLASQPKNKFSRIYSALFSVLFIVLAMPATSQVDIEWQKSFGTPFTDNALQVFPDEKGNIIVIGLETHADFTGNLRPYMMTSKMDPAGNVIWKTYHDVAFNTFNPPLDYSVGKHFYTEEFGDTLLNLVININQQVLQYKILDQTGDYYFYEIATSDILDVDRQNEKVYANVLCSIQQSCYGPDSLVVEKFDPSPDSIIFNPIEWTFQMKQNFRTAPIQGHYDFDIQDISMDGSGNTFLLVQIERWDFQFCTDCADAFVDAWSEVFKFDHEGNLVKHVNLKTVKAVVAGMRFVRLSGEDMIIQINDINAAGTKLLTTLYRLDHELSLQKKIEMNEAYFLVQADEDNNFFTSRNIFDESNPEIKGLSDVLVSAYNANGDLLWDEYYGGSSWDFPYGLSLANDGSLYVLANTESSDFDVDENFGGQDIWLVKLSEAGATGVDEHLADDLFSVFPNPATDFIMIGSSERMQIVMNDLQGREVLRKETGPMDLRIDLTSLPEGCYVLTAINDSQHVFSSLVVKMKTD
jgi:hypothetical protein